MSKDYFGLTEVIQPDDLVTAYYIDNTTDKTYGDLVQIEKDGQIIVDQGEFKRKESYLIYIGLVGVLFSLVLSVR
ncbi:MAG: hypothetical protein DI538_19380 [Azospira oryzae]|nr:MAG: hypothetical protein DI538_19380 [Azospira oryzae]